MDKIQLTEILHVLKNTWQPAAGVIFMLENNWLDDSQIELLYHFLKQTFEKAKTEIDI